VVVDPGTITIIKDASPQGGASFSFTADAPIGPFALVDDGGPAGRRTVEDVAPGTYVVAEEQPRGWLTEAITCVDPSNDSTVDLAGRSVTIRLGAGEAVACTFRNVQRGALPATGLVITQVAVLGLAAVALGRALRAVARRGT
jgi:hypothetical protein